jgi:hypothetical protein
MKYFSVGQLAILSCEMHHGFWRKNNVQQNRKIGKYLMMVVGRLDSNYNHKFGDGI